MNQEEIPELKLRYKIVDSREPDKEGAELRSKLLEVGWQQQRCIAGDFWFHTGDFQRVGISRKTVDDFIKSLNGHLAKELDALIEHFPFRILLLEGNWKRAIGEKIISARGIEYLTWSMAWNFIRTWQDKGVTIELTTSLGHTIKRLNELFAYYQAPCHTGGLNRQVVGDSRILALACGGIGIKLGEKLLEKFGSLKRIANASPEEFEQMDKIGSKKSMNLWQHFNRGDIEDRVLDLSGKAVLNESEVAEMNSLQEKML